MADILIIAAIAVGAFFAFRSIWRGEGECSTCGSASGCQARLTGKGHCSVAQDMLRNADIALGDKTDR